MNRAFTVPNRHLFGSWEATQRPGKTLYRRIAWYGTYLTFCDSEPKAQDSHCTGKSCSPSVIQFAHLSAIMSDRGENGKLDSYTESCIRTSRDGTTPLVDENTAATSDVSSITYKTESRLQNETNANRRHVLTSPRTVLQRGEHSELFISIDRHQILYKTPNNQRLENNKGTHQRRQTRGG